MQQSIEHFSLFCVWRIKQLITINSNSIGSNIKGCIISNNRKSIYRICFHGDEIGLWPWFAAILLALCSCHILALSSKWKQDKSNSKRRTISDLCTFNLVNSVIALRQKTDMSVRKLVMRVLAMPYSLSLANAEHCYIDDDHQMILM